MKKIKLPDSSFLEVEDNATLYDIAKKISNRLAKEALCGSVNDNLVDLSYIPKNGDSVKIFTFKDEEGKSTFWHTSAHILAQAVKRLKPDAKLGIGPSIAEGFYYDISLPENLSFEDVPKIEAEMQKIIKENLPIKRKELTKEEAIKLFKEKGEDFKIELIEELEEDIVSVYEQGEFIDLCRGPHLPSTGYVKYIKIMKLSGAYWKGDENNPMLQRFYGISFPKKSMLDEYLYIVEEAKKRDHKKLGKELELFTFFSEGPGFPFWYPKGTVLYNLVVDFCREILRKYGYQEIKTPLILNESLWHKSGHWNYYKDNMYFTKIDEENYAVKPMNCPGHLLIYKSKKHSYKELPLKLAEFGIVHRHEKSGVLNGLFRVRMFTQDDAHIFCTQEGLEKEIIELMELIDEVYKTFGFENYKVELSTRPEKSIGSDEMWEKAENALKNALEKKGVNYKINEGEGAFYGPKIDFHITDSLKREWQCGTIQVDFSMPERFELEYIGSDGNPHRPVMIHRAILGSVERFIGNLIEHYAGNFPVWLAPVQVRVISITSEINDYAYEIYNKLFKNNIRVEIDVKDETIGNKIRRAEMEKIPYMILVGKKEKENNNISVRKHTKGNLGIFSLEEFLSKLKNEIDSRIIE